MTSRKTAIARPSVAVLRQWLRDHRRKRLASGRRGRPSRALLSLLGCLLLLALLTVWCFSELAPDERGKELQLHELQAAAAAGQVKSVVLLDEDARLLGRHKTDGRFWTAYPRNDSTASNLIVDLQRSGAAVRVEPQTGKAIVRILLTVLLPLMILANLFALFLMAGKRGGSALGEVVTFGQLRKGRSAAAAPSGETGFRDVAGLDEAVEEMTEVVDYLKNPARYEAMGAAPPKGVLLFGPPGCGKTLLARSVAGEAGVPFFSVAGAEFVESLVGVGAARVRDLFQRVRDVAPAIVFIDELDAAGRRRSGGGGGGSDERDQTLNQLLVEMDGFDSSAGIVVMAATNRPDILDPALMRPGRFDRHITIEKPDLERRRAILELHAKRKPGGADADLDTLARQTPGFSGADLASVVNEAALLTIRGGEATLTNATFRLAVERVRNGPQRRGTILTEAERRRLAVHEAGHAVALALSGQAGAIHRLSILATPQALASTGLERVEEPALLTRGQLQQRLVACFGGSAAEELILKEPSTGSEQDLARATTLARDIVGRYGMDAEVGRRRLLLSDADVFLGGGSDLGDVSPAAHDQFDDACRRLLDDAFASATTLIRRHRRNVDAIVDRLLELETIDGSELEELLPATAPPRGGSITAVGRSRVG